jgi:hypothetical protein
LRPRVVRIQLPATNQRGRCKSSASLRFCCSTARDAKEGADFVPALQPGGHIRPLRLGACAHGRRRRTAPKCEGHALAPFLQLMRCRVVVLRPAGVPEGAAARSRARAARTFQPASDCTASSDSRSRSALRASAGCAASGSPPAALKPALRTRCVRRSSFVPSARPSAHGMVRPRRAPWCSRRDPRGGTRPCKPSTSSQQPT